MQVIRGRDEQKDWDYFLFKCVCTCPPRRRLPKRPLAFKTRAAPPPRAAAPPPRAATTRRHPPPPATRGRLRCGLGISAEWTEFVNLPYENRLFRETRSVTCKRGMVATGLRVYRGFQNWGDLDTYEFQLYCAPSVAASALKYDKGEL